MQVKLLAGCLMCHELDVEQSWQVEVMLPDLLSSACKVCKCIYLADTTQIWMTYWAAARNAPEWVVHPTQRTLTMLMQQTTIQSVLQQDLHNNGSFQDAAYGASCQKRFRFANFHM